MTTLQDKFNKLYSARAKLEAELNNIYGEVNNAVDKQDRKVKVERLIVKCKDAFTRVVDKNEELFDLAQKTENQDAACENLEKWLETVTKKTDEFIAAARHRQRLQPLAALCVKVIIASGSVGYLKKSLPLSEQG